MRVYRHKVDGNDGEWELGLVRLFLKCLISR